MSKEFKIHVIDDEKQIRNLLQKIFMLEGYDVMTAGDRKSETFDNPETGFLKFVKVDSKKSESYRGVGLGLAISKEFVTAHGGEINVISEPGIGSEFYFSIPYK